MTQLSGSQTTQERPLGRSGSPDDRPPIVAAQRLTKVFKDFWMRRKVRALHELDFEIRPGEVFGLIGPNGSGKSTTIKIILGLLHKTSGRVAVFGKPPENVHVKKRIGYLPEDSYLYPYLNARETLDFYGKLFGLPRDVRKRRIDELLEMVGLDAVQFRAIGEYSKGMQRRIGIAQALINDPDFLILDEPTSGLDPIGIRQIKDLILHLRQRGKTILLSSHLLADVEDVCDYMVILYGGRKQQEGTREELLTTHERTVIETDSLNDVTIEEVRQFLREHGNHELLRVSPARQSLESLFLDIVEKAQSQRVETFGAKAGGQTAAFLGESSRASESEGDALLDRLTRDADEEPASGEQSAAADEGPAASAEDQAESDRTPSESRADASTSSSSTAPAEARKEDVDRSILDSLVGRNDDESKPAAGDDDHDHHDDRGDSEAVAHARETPDDGNGRSSEAGRSDKPTAGRLRRESGGGAVDESVLQSLVEAYGEPDDASAKTGSADPGEHADADADRESGSASGSTRREGSRDADSHENEKNHPGG